MKPKKTIYAAALPRLETWALLEAAIYGLRPAKGYHRRTVEPELTIMFLKSADWVFGLRGMKHLNDPIITRDFGGEEETWKIRLKIRKAVTLIRKGKYRAAMLIVSRLRTLLFEHAVKRFLEWMASGMDTDENLSYRKYTKKMKITPQMVKTTKEIRERLLNEPR